jgi:hypothetical protein
MAVYMSPGVFPREVDISYVVTGFGALRPAIIGTAQKGPLNEPVYITSAQQYIDTFGEPFAESYLGYAVLAYLEEGNQCYVERVGVEWEEGLPEELDSVAIDMSGAKKYGWGRIPVFSGIDNGKIALREPTATDPIQFHNAAVTGVEFTDIDPTVPTDATLDFTGAGLSDDYIGVIDDTWVMLITADPTATGGSSIDGAEYQITRNSDGEVIEEGVIVESATPGTSEPITVGAGEDATGLIFSVVVSSGTLAEQDSFIFSAQPNNRQFGFWVDRAEGSAGAVINEYEMDANAWYDGVTPGHTVDDFVDDFNSIDMGSGELQLVEDYKLQNLNGIPTVVTNDAGSSIQLMPIATGEGEAWSLEVGKSLYSWSIPRARLVSTSVGPFNINSSNDRIKINTIDANETTTLEFSIANGTAVTATTLASQIHAGGVQAGKRYWRSYALQISDTNYLTVIEADPTNQLITIEMMANFSNIKTLNFAEEVNINYPYSDSYDGFSDPRLWAPEQGSLDPSTPKSCEDDPLSAQCALDSDYYEHIVGYLVATSPGAWVDGLTVSLAPFVTGPTDSAGRYTLTVQDNLGNQLENIQDISFDPDDDRYIANILNPGSAIGGVNGNDYFNWQERATAIANDPSDSSYEIRLPATFSQTSYIGGENGIPEDPAYSSALDAVVIGNPASASGVYAFENPEVYDINLLATPGFSSGAVIGQSIQMAQSRGDTLYLVDPPYGLRPQQVVDWHNGMLTSDLRQAINSSYAALYWSWLEIYDQFNNQNLWIPPSGHILSVFARTSRVAEQWFAPAGLRRGRLLTPLDVEYNPTLPERDLMYGSGNAVNPIVNFPQDGITVWGQRTLQRTASALDRVNVRMLLSYIKKNLTRGLRPFVFEQNDEVTWTAARTVAQSFLADIKARRGLEDYRVVCDESTNTPERRDRNEMWISIFIKPTKVVEFIVLTIVVMRSTQSFAAEEVLAQGGVVTGE